MKEKEIERILKALANKRRLAIIKILHRKKEMTVGEIAESIKLSFRATSKHLSILASAGILEREQRSLQNFYSIDPSAHELIKRLLSILVAV